MMLNKCGVYLFLMMLMKPNKLASMGMEGVEHKCSRHRYRKSLNRLLKVCYVPATSAVLIAFFSSSFGCGH